MIPPNFEFSQLKISTFLPAILLLTVLIVACSLWHFCSLWLHSVEEWPVAVVIPLGTVPPQCVCDIWIQSGAAVIVDGGKGRLVLSSQTDPLPSLKQSFWETSNTVIGARVSIEQKCMLHGRWPQPGGIFRKPPPKVQRYSSCWKHVKSKEKWNTNHAKLDKLLPPSPEAKDGHF